jgi:hypothetical protein
MAQALNIIGEIARTNGDDGHAVRVYEESLAICRQTGETRRICYLYDNLAYIAQHEGDHTRAIGLGRHALQLARDRGDRHGMVSALVVLAGSFAATGEPQRGARLLGALNAAVERLGAFDHPSDRADNDRIVATVRAQFDDPTYQERYGEGRRMTLEQAAADALGEPGPASRF